MGVALLNHFQNVNASDSIQHQKINEYSFGQRSISINLSKYGNKTASLPEVAPIAIDLSDVLIGLLVLKTSVRFAGSLYTIDGIYQRITLTVNSSLSALNDLHTVSMSWSTKTFDTYGTIKIDESETEIKQSMFLNLTTGRSLIHGNSSTYGLDATNIKDADVKASITGEASASWGTNGGETAVGTVYFGPSTVELYTI